MLLHHPTTEWPNRSATRSYSSQLLIHANIVYVLDLKALKSSIMMLLALMSLSPVLRTLTAATSSDSIWALSAVLFLLNTLLADYTSLKPDEYARER